MRNQPLKGKILVVDDDKEFRDAAASIFDMNGYVTINASGGMGAIEMLESNRFDVIITDIHMPDGSGIDLLSTIRRCNPDLSAVIVVTGQLDAQDEGALQLAAHSVFKKPFDVNALLSAIEDIVSSNRRAREKQS